MMRVLAVIALAGVVRCTALHEGCSASLPPSEQFRSLPKGDLLREQLRDVLAALAAPDADGAAIAATGLESPETSGQHPVTDAGRCFTVVRMTVEKNETPVVVSFDLSSRNNDEPDFVMFASLIDDRWRFTWPARLGPGEIPGAVRVNGNHTGRAASLAS